MTNVSLRTYTLQCEFILLIISVLLNDFFLATSRVEHHIYRTYMFSYTYLKECSEMSIIVKYWSNIFELFFGYNRNIFLQW
jgi:hypothetical protein